MKRVFPPEVSVHELAHGVAGWTLRLRINNFSTVPMRFSDLQLALTLDGAAAGSLQSQPDLVIDANSSESLDLPLTPQAAAPIRASLDADRALRYQLNGWIRSSEPREKFEIEYRSALNPVPGLTDVLR